MITILHTVFKIPLKLAFPLGILGDMLLIYTMAQGVQP